MSSLAAETGGAAGCRGCISNQSKRMFFALVPSLLRELATAAGAIVAGWLIVLLGNLVVDPKAEARIRLLVFAVGGGAFALALVICQRFWAAFTTQHYPQVLGFDVGVAVLMCGAGAMSVAAFCSNETIRHWVHRIIRGK